MLPPLPVGMHTIRAGGGHSLFGNIVDVTNVIPVPEPSAAFLLLPGLGFVVGLGAIRRRRAAKLGG